MKNGRGIVVARADGIPTAQGQGGQQGFIRPPQHIKSPVIQPEAKLVAEKIIAGELDPEQGGDAIGRLGQEVHHGVVDAGQARDVVIIEGRLRRGSGNGGAPLDQASQVAGLEIAGSERRDGGNPQLARLGREGLGVA